MKNHLKNFIVALCFMITLTGFMLANILSPDKALSISERRFLSRMPDFSTSRLLSGKFFAEFEKYCLDQFVLRDQFRGLKAMVVYNIFARMDNNGIYIVDGAIYKMGYPLNENSVFNAAKKFNQLQDQYFQDLNVYYAVIPDKNYFVAAENGYLTMDYDRMLEILVQNVRGAYIDLFSALEVSDYYRTDIHWRQDKIEIVASKLLTAMGVEYEPAIYVQKEIRPFYGSYYGQAALSLPPDRLVYLTSDSVENALVYDFEDNTYGKVYAETAIELNPYDIFLSGAKPLLSIENPACTSGRELIIFRDSFASSLAPLLVEEYEKIILVDLRYVSSEVLDDHIDFLPNQDVLFLYSTDVINNSWMLR